MKYVIAGGAGHISKPIVEKFLAAGHLVTVIGRHAENLKELVDQGATAAVGSVNDVKFLTETFDSANAVYTMVPPNLAAADLKSWIGQTGAGYADAIKKAGVKYVVNLSSIGAHLPDGAGPVSGLYRAEQALNALKDVNIKHLRPSYFFNNFLGNTGMVKQLNILGGNFGGENFKMALADTNDIAETAVEELLKLNFTGHSIRYIASDERNINEVAKIIGAAIGKPELPWIVFSNEQAYEGMVQAGLPQEIAKNYAEMGNALHTGAMTEDYWKNHPSKFGKIKVEDFAKTFAAVYHAN
ncbi:MAG: NAD-dependent dehydratase [Chitinophagaceae bacterium]|nr:NAD-dependent dehydratase [Chitinophagaceae bacterium]